MSEHFKHDPSPAPPQSESEVIALIKRMQQQLAFLEKKIDILINQSSERSFKGRPFSKPFRPGGHSPRQDKREHDKKPFFHRRRDRG